MLIGLARVSTQDQNLELQHDAPVKTYNFEKKFNHGDHGETARASTAINHPLC